MCKRVLTRWHVMENVTCRSRSSEMLAMSFRGRQSRQTSYDGVVEKGYLFYHQHVPVKSITQR